MIRWDYGNPEATEVKFREILPQFPKHELVYLELLTQITCTHSLRRNFDEAHQILDEVQKELKEDFYAVDAIHMLAIVADPASALDLNLRAIQLAESSPDE